MTFSVAGRCARTGRFGVVVASSSPAVAARCIAARTGVGAAGTQNVTEPTLGEALLDALQDGASAGEAMDRVVAGATHPEYRQLFVIDAQGQTHAHSGTNMLGRHRTLHGLDVVAAGNLLVSSGVPEAMIRAFESDTEGHLGDRLLASLVAGEAAGGEEGPVHSCGMLVVHDAPWPETDLRVDWSDRPIGALREAWEIWKPQAEAYVTRAMHPDRAPSYGVPGDE